MKGKFGGKQPTGTPSLGWSTVVVVVSLLSGASVVHNIFKPDLTLPPIEGVNVEKMQQPGRREECKCDCGQGEVHRPCEVGFVDGIWFSDTVQQYRGVVHQLYE